MTIKEVYKLICNIRKESVQTTPGEVAVYIGRYMYEGPNTHLSSGITTIAFMELLATIGEMERKVGNRW